MQNKRKRKKFVRLPKTMSNKRRDRKGEGLQIDTEKQDYII